MNAPLQLIIGILAAHRNQYLFSDHDLDCLLCDDPYLFKTGLGSRS